MIKKLHLKSLLLLAVMLLGAGSAWAETSTLTFTSACKGSGTADDGVVWTVTSDGEESTYSEPLGIHYGTSSATVQYIKLSTSDISGTITKVVVNASTASGVSATVDVTVGGEAFGGNPKTLSNEGTDYTFSGSASGEIIVNVKKPQKAKKALYVKSITVTYGSGGTSAKTETTVTITDITETATIGETINAPQAVVNAGTETVTSPAIKWSSSDVGVATIDESTGEITLLTEGTTTITATYEGNDTYEESSASFDLTVSPAAVPPTTYTTIAELQGNATDTKTPITFTFNNILVTAVKGQNAYITDGEYGALIYTKDHGFKAGDIINGTIETNLQLFKGQTEITDVKASDVNLTITSGTVTPTEKDLEDITAANQSLLVTLKGLTYNSSNKTFSSGANTITYYKSFASTDPKLENGKVYDVTGVIIVYNTTIEISPLSADDIVEVVSATQEVPESAWKADGEAITSVCILPGDNLSATFETTSTGDKSFVSSNTAVATVDDNGAITLTGTAGVAVITAATEANDEFFASSATLTVVVAEKEAEDGVFDFALFNDYGSGIVPDGDANNTEESTWTAGNVTMKVSGKDRWFLSTKNVSDFRLYSAAEGNPQTSFTITVPAGYYITSINGVVSSLTADKGEINSTTWNGMENEVTFTYNSTSTITIKKLIVNYSKPEVTVTTGDDYTTFCSNVPLDFSESGLKVYTAKQSKGAVVLTEVTSGKIPAVRGIILKGEAGEHTAKVIASADKLENNELYGVTTDTEVEYQPSKTMFNYILQGGVFKKATGATLKAGKAYLHTAYDITGGGESRMTIVINNETTGISSATEQAGDGAVYSLSGQRVVNPAKGLYIVNGKKYVIK